jgi:hypothetical protein
VDFQVGSFEKETRQKPSAYATEQGIYLFPVNTKSGLAHVSLFFKDNSLA